MSIFAYLYKKIALLSPRIEVKLRQLYWRNSRLLYKYNPNRSSTSSLIGQSVNFDLIIGQLKDWGVGKGSLLIVHSSYDELRCTGLSPLEIIEKLRGLIGETGTLVMPVIRKYKGIPEGYEQIFFDYDQLECIYNPQKTPIVTGLLPCMLIRIPGAEISKHPLSTLCAIGPLAKEMMVNNIKGDEPSPHGINSSWKFCLDHQAKVCSIGTNLRHHNTMGHVAEEAFGDWYWPDDAWYDKRKFVIESKGEEPIRLIVKARKPEWGMLHQAEWNRYRDFLTHGIIRSKRFDSVLVEYEDSQELISYLRKKNKKGYPYFK